MKRLLCIVLLATLLFGTLGSSPAPARAKTGSPADIMPANTSLYVELDTSDLPGVIDTLADLVGRAGFPVNRQIMLAGLDSGLRDMLQGASFSEDVLPWLGPSIGAGVIIPEDLPAGQNPLAGPEGMFIATVKDDVAARGFLEEMVATIEGRGVELERTETTLNGEKVIGYAYEPENTSNTGMAWLPGYLVFGPVSSLRLAWENLQGGGPVLGGQATFAAVWGQFRPGSLVKGYVDGALIETLMASAAQSQSLGAQEQAMLSGLELFKAFQALGFALRGEGRTLALDLYGSIDTAREAELMDRAGLPPFALSPNGGQLAARIPADAITVIDWGDLAGLINYLRNIPAFEAQFTEASEQLNEETRIDLEADVLSWLGGEFAIYGVLDAEAVTQGSMASAPFTWTLLVSVDDPASVRGLLGKLDAAFTRLAADVQPDPFTKLAEDFYAIDTGDESMGKLAYGLVNDTFVLTLGGDPGVAAAAARGDGTLDQTPAWQHVVEEVPAFNQPVFFLNLDALSALVAEAGGRASGMSDPTVSQLVNVLNLFDGALIYGSDQGDGNVFASAALLLREPLK